MRIETLISGKNGDEKVMVEGVSIPVSALRKLQRDGYVHMTAYKYNKTFSMWGKTCSGCFTEQNLREME